MELNESHKGSYIACNFEQFDFEIFDTKEAAKEWCNDINEEIVSENKIYYPDLNIPEMGKVCVLKVEMVNMFDGEKYFVN